MNGWRFVVGPGIRPEVTPGWNRGGPYYHVYDTAYCWRVVWAGPDVQIAKAARERFEREYAD